MRRYLELLRLPGIPRVTASQLFARLPLGMISLAILLHVEHVSGSYATAGATVAFVSIGQAVAVPFTSRLVGTLGIRATVSITATINAGGLVVLSLVPLDGVIPFAIGLLIGASVPPIMPAIRALYPRLVPEDKVSALFALDTTAQELIWIGGPVLAAALSSASSPALSLWAAAAITVVGTAWFVTTPRLSEVTIAPATGTVGRVMLNRSVLLAMIASGALMASFMALELGVVARFDGDEGIAAVALAVSAFGSLVGGLTLGHRRFRLPEIVGAFAIVAIGTGLAAVAPDFLLLVLALFVAGFGFAPGLAALYYMVSNVVEEKSAAEAFGWLSTAGLAGAAAGTALGGLMSEQLGFGGAFLAALLLTLVTVIAPLLARIPGPLQGLAR